MKRIVVLGTPIQFPFDPYPPQITYMQYVIETLHKRANCALEAQTGFGKSVCLFCSVIAFRLQFSRALELLRRLAVNYDVPAYRYLDAIATEFQTTREDLQLQIEFIRANSVLSVCIVGQNIVSQVEKPPQVFFLTRTHTQLLQAANCLKRLEVANLTVTYLGARYHFCLNEAAKEIADKQNISLATVCKSFVKNKKCQFRCQSTAQQAVDLEQLLVQGMASQSCPYFASRGAMSSDIVLAPYQYLFDSEVVENIKNAIIIIDEAHNFEQSLKEHVSCKFMLDSLNTALSCLNIARTVASELANSMKGHGTQSDVVSTVSTTPDSAAFFLGKMAQIDTAIAAFQRVQSNCKALIAHQDVGRAFGLDSLFDGIYFDRMVQDIGDLGTYCDYLIYNLPFDVKRFKSKAPYLYSDASSIYRRYQFELLPELFPLLDIGISAHSAQNNRYDFCVLLEKAKDSYYIAVHCLNIKLVTHKLRALQPFAMIMTSATLSPLGNLESEMGVEFAAKYSLPSIIAKNQVTVRTLRDERLIGTYANRGEEYYVLLCKILGALTEYNERGGVLVFLPSYYFMNEVKARYRGRTAFFENEKNAFEKYSRSIASRPVLFAVARGSFSEGIDFADDLCRMVVMVSIPFPDTKSRLLAEQKSWFDKHGMGLTGREYYENLAFRAVNQCIGRVIRHKDDHGTIVFVDNRYSDIRCQAKISLWIRQEQSSISSQTLLEMQRAARDSEDSNDCAAPELIAIPKKVYRAERKVLTRESLDMDELCRKKYDPAGGDAFKRLIVRIKELNLYDKLKSASKLMKANLVQAAIQIAQIFGELSAELDAPQMYVFLANLDDAILSEVIARI